MTARKLFALVIALCLSVSGMLAVRAAERPGDGQTAAAGPGNSTTTSMTLPDPASTSTTWEPMPRPTDAPPTTTGDGGTTTTVPTGDGDGNPPPGAPRTVPPGAQRQIDSVPRSSPNNTSVLMDALQPLVDEFGLTETEAWVIGFGRFPVAGPASFTHDWQNARYTPSFHLHQGTDIFASLGTPVRAPFDGVLRHGDGGAGGTSAYVTMPDGTFAYNAHLAAWVPGQQSGQHVKQGEVIGFVGNTGNAEGGAHHNHFELHPKGGAAVDPKAYLDLWIAEAIAQAPALDRRLPGSEERRTGRDAGRIGERGGLHARAAGHHPPGARPRDAVGGIGQPGGGHARPREQRRVRRRNSHALG